MADLRNVSEENLARRGRDFARRGQFALANEFLSEYCARAMPQEKAIPAPVLAAYGLAVGFTTDLKEGIEICYQALSSDRRNPEVYLSLARLHAEAGSRKRAIEALERGLSISKNHRGLSEMLQQLGQRQIPLVPFLARENPLNVKLGRFLHRLRGSRQKGKAGLLA
jgi:tetratricopeptide (TPR) repeat protein